MGEKILNEGQHIHKGYSELLRKLDKVQKKKKLLVEKYQVELRKGLPGSSIGFKP